MQNLRAIILAAGKGTRMKSNTPKVLHEICGKPMIQYVLDAVKSAGSSKTFVILGHKKDEIAERLADENVVIEQKKLLGTADAIKCAESRLKSFKGDTLVMCGDTPLVTKNTIKDVVRRHKKAKATCTFLTAVLHNPQGYGRVIRDENANVVAVREDKDAVGYERDIAEINVGVYCFKTSELFKALKEIKMNAKKKEFYLTDIFEYFREKGMKVETVETEDKNEGLGINTRDDLSRAQSILRDRTLKSLMLEGVTILDPNTTYVDATAKIGKDTVIRPFSFIEGNVRIGDNCEIGPFARLRPGTKIGNNVVVGNFTEVSRSKIGNKTILKHFCFLGDAAVGANVNIGAGTVTANYDGESKNSTKILDGAFIGSDAVIVAPAKVGKRAVLGAGSVLSKGKSVPDGAKAYGVPAVVQKKGKRK